MVKQTEKLINAVMKHYCTLYVFTFDPKVSNDQVLKIEVTTVMLETSRFFLILPSSETRHQDISFPTLDTSSAVAENIHRNKNSRNISKTSRFLSRG